MLHSNIMPVCTLAPESARYAAVEVRSLRFDGVDLVIEFQGRGFSYGRLTFRMVAGFRVLHERNLTEFWTDYDGSSGWLWEVHSGGWLDLECERPGFIDVDFLPQMREYLVVGTNAVSVFAVEPPEIEDFGADPTQ